MRKFYFIISFFVLCTTLAEGAGTEKMQFLEIAPGVRGAGMAEAHTAVVGDVDCIWWNPAGLCDLNKRQLTCLHVFWLDDISIEHFAFGSKVGRNNALGGNVSIIRMPDLTRTLEDGSGLYYGEDGTFSASGLLAGIAYAHSFNSALALGLNLKYVKESIDKYVLETGACDLGLLYVPLKQKYRFGLSIKNLGFDNLPAALVLGFSYQSCNGFLLALDTNEPFRVNPLSFSNKPKFNVGIEWRCGFTYLDSGFAIRTGYKFDQELESISRVSAGLGYKFVINTLVYKLDYAFIPFGDLGFTKRLSLSLAF